MRVHASWDNSKPRVPCDEPNGRRIGNGGHALAVRGPDLGEPRKRARHTFNYELLNSPNPDGQISSVWRIPTVPQREKLHGYHPTQKPLRLVGRALLASTRKGELVFDPFCGSGTTAVAAKELDRAFVGAELEEEFARLAARRVRTTRGELTARDLRALHGPLSSCAEVSLTRGCIRRPLLSWRRILYPAVRDPVEQQGLRLCSALHQ